MLLRMRGNFLVSCDYSVFPRRLVRDKKGEG